MSFYGWRPYVPVAERRRQAGKKMDALRKQGVDIKPVSIEGRKIARTFWGEAWCDHMESFSDYENRLPRGRTYVRNGSVCHLEITRGEVHAMVSGSRLYAVNIAVNELPVEKWERVKNRCGGQIGSLLELLQGKLSANVMSVVTDRDEGLFPLPGELYLQCSCPDWAVMCKHVAAVLYGVGARLDEDPQLLFLLRGVDHEELISVDAQAAVATAKSGSRKQISDDELADVFGIELSDEPAPAETQPSPPPEKTSSKPKQPPSRKKKQRTNSRKKQDEEKRQPQVGRGRRKEPSSDPSNVPPVTSEAVVRLRAKFGMSRSRFARLLGVSALCIANWENKPGKLNLQDRSRNAWYSASKLTKRRAWQKLERT